MMTTVAPNSGLAVSGGSSFFAYDTNNIVWPSLASKTGTTASSVFQYVGPNSSIGQAQVKHSVTNILTAAGASTVS